MKLSLDKQQLLGMAAAIGAYALFGLSYVAVRQGVSAVSTLTLLSWRFLLAFLAMLLCRALGIFHVHLKGKPLGLLLLIALLQPVCYYLFETLGIQLTSVSESGTFMASIPLVTLLLMPLLAHEQPTRRQWISIAISVAGIIVVGIAKWAGATLNPWGYGALFLAVISDAVFLNLSRRADAYTGIEKTYVMTLLGAVAFTLGALAENGMKGTLRAYLLLPFQNMQFLLSCLYLSLGCSVGAFILRNAAVARLGPGRTGSFNGICTLVSVLSGVLFLHESFSLLQGVGTLLVLMGVYGANSLPRRARLDQPPLIQGQEERR